MANPIRRILNRLDTVESVQGLASDVWIPDEDRFLHGWESYYGDNAPALRFVRQGRMVHVSVSMYTETWPLPDDGDGNSYILSGEIPEAFKPYDEAEQDTCNLCLGDWTGPQEDPPGWYAGFGALPLFVYINKRVWLVKWRVDQLVPADITELDIYGGFNYLAALPE